MLKKILFIDRDGTLIEEPKNNFQVDSIKKLSLEPDVIIALKSLINHSFLLVMITNQDGLGNKQFPYEKFYPPHNLMINIFKSQGITFKKILICPHELKDNCLCRKPKTELVKFWINNKDLDKLNSYVIGDRETDLQLAKNMGIKGILYKRKKKNWNFIKNKIINNRCAKIIRQTQETFVSTDLQLNSNRKSTINTGIFFFDHMLHQMAIHGNLYCNIKCIGDIKIDDHHTIEDTGIAIGQTLLKLLGEKKGIERYAFSLPMDESQAHCILDISGRPFLKFNANFKYQKIGDLSTEMIKHFFYSLSYSMKITIHISANGENDHHLAESIFKAFGKTLKQATLINIDKPIPSSKGIL